MLLSLSSDDDNQWQRQHRHGYGIVRNGKHGNTVSSGSEHRVPGQAPVARVGAAHRTQQMPGRFQRVSDRDGHPCRETCFVPNETKLGGKGKQTTGNENKNMNQNETRPRGGVKREREDAPCERGELRVEGVMLTRRRGFLCFNRFFLLLHDGTRSFSCLACKRRELCWR